MQQKKQHILHVLGSIQYPQILSPDSAQIQLKFGLQKFVHHQHICSFGLQAWGKE
jgi:hypothetical protein